VQRVQLKDLKGTKAYERWERAFKVNEPIPPLVVQISKSDNDVPKMETGIQLWIQLWVHIKWIIAYWSRVLKSGERNYSPTEWEALALKEGLIKFQPCIEGETILAVTNHAALTWSKTFQNVNWQLLTWGMVFKFADHPLSGTSSFQCWSDFSATLASSLSTRAYCRHHTTYFPQLNWRPYTNFVALDLVEELDYSYISADSLEISLPSRHKLTLNQLSSNSYSVL
jgi:hypothetical protein